MVTHEPDIAQFAKRMIVFRDGMIRRDEQIVDRPRAPEALKAIPALQTGATIHSPQTR
jgi:hypothetical protein